ncbi:MAG: xanthine dehydrogenase family protein subunit M [Burkholderiaceae bacterium]
MKPPVFDYFSPASVDEALALLGEHGDNAKLLAGGQSLMPALNFRLAAPAALIDLNPLDALAGVQMAPDGRLVAGAMTRHRFFETSALIAQRLPLVHHAMASVAHVAIRNRGTIGGSLCYADPSAEWPALCLACDAEMVLQSSRGIRRLPAAEFSLSLFTTALAPTEMLVQVVFPAWPATRRWGFQEIARRHGDFAIVGIACLLDVEPSGVCTQARIVAFGVNDSPLLLRAAAAELTGRTPTERHVRNAALNARHVVECRSDHHASAQYRSELVQALTARALTQALNPRNPLHHG